MKIYKNLLILLILTAFTFSCFDDNDDNSISASEINDFIWKGMNAFYLYNANVPDLANDRFTSDQEYADYLNSFSSPESLFESLIYERPTVDRFSWIVDDYIALEQLFSGVTTRSGYEYNLYAIPGSATDVFGVVRLVLPGSNADDNNLLRGQVFTSIDGTTLTRDNYSSLISADSYALGFSDYNNNGTPENLGDDIITPNATSITLTREVYTENPIFKTAIIDVDGENVGYLMYNGFTSDFDSQLNTAFADFAANNVQHLVLDLRYNPGGSVRTATYLGSMITGQFIGQTFAKLVYNSNFQSNNQNYNYTNQLDNGSAINSLSLDKVYIIATEDSASASEMMINSLGSYVDVIQIGENTVGKSQASITLYDSPNFQRENVNPRHSYAMQPLVANTLNKFDQSVPSNGLTPTSTFEISENPSNFGVLGEASEPLLAKALADIEGTGRYSLSFIKITPLATSNSLISHGNEMYIDTDFLIDFQINRNKEE